MSNEGDTKVPPEQGGDSSPAIPNIAAAAAAAPQPNSTTKSETNESNSKPSANKSTKAYDKKWLENLNLLKPCIMADGTMDYSSLSEEEQKRMQNFAKDQRKCYRKRENNEISPMTDERFRLLSEANFNFKPSETNKARSEEKKKKKKAEKKKSSAAVSSKKSSSGDSGTPRAKTFEYVETAESLKKKPSSDEKKKLTPLKTDDSSPDSKMPAKKSPKEASASSGKSPKSASKASSPTPSSSRKKSGKLTYIEMVHDAIVALKDRSGSSSVAISKWILANNDHTKSVSPNMYKSRVNLAIKTGVKEERFIKVKNSYKISPEWKKKEQASKRAKEASRKKAQKELEKSKQKRQEELDKAKAEQERKRKLEEMTPEERAEVKRKKEEKARKEAERKEIEQKLRRRRFPIEDTKLHREDKLWKVKPPKSVGKRPALPYTLTCLVPPHLRVNTPKNYQGPEARASTSGTGTLMGGNNDRGLVADAITVYHFFCGDVGLEDADYPFPKFSLKTLFYALDEVLNGNAKAAKSIPPLLTHLFVTALRMLTAPQHVEGDEDDDEDDIEPVDARLQKDLAELRGGLNPVSWSQTCFFYMDLMHRYYSSDVSLEDSVLPGEGKLDMSYYWNKDKMDEDGIETETKKESGDEDGDELPNRYYGYLGDEQGVLWKGHYKLQNQKEPWHLTAAELMALLRTLTDDIMAKRPDLAEDIAGRGAKLYELTKAKRAAIIKYNKVKLAYEGPKKPMRQKKSNGNDDKSDNKNDEEAGADSKEEEEEEKEEKPFVPTATKKQFETAEKAYHKAVEALDNGLTKLIARTEPIGFDRHFNAIYFFRHDPSMLHIELLKQSESKLPPEIKSLGENLTPMSTWHFIDTKSLYEQFLESLDKRGQRENETLLICQDLIILKRRLQDDKGPNTRAIAREREKEDLERRLENAKNACDAEDGRRSGRLAGMAQGELKEAELALKQMAIAHEEEERQEKIGRDKASDYNLLTGLQMVTDLFSGQRSTRSSRKSDDKVETEADKLANAPPNKLWLDDRIGGNGTLNLLVEALFSLEKKCNDLTPWTRQDITREAWRKRLSDASCAWAIDCMMQLGPSADDKGSNGESNALTNPSPTKKQKVEPASGTSLANIVNTVKLCLKDLEQRVFEISGKKRSFQEEDMVAAEDKDDSSDEEDNEELNKRRNNWKVKIHALKRVPVVRYGLIRDIIVAAITVARKSHLNQVAAELKVALQLFRPHAASEARTAAIQVLHNHGGYEGDDDEEEDFDELAAANVGDANPAEDEDADIASLLADEVRMVNGSIGGDDFADASDWSDAIKECKSVSRLALILQSFLLKSGELLDQIKEDRERLRSALRSKSGLKKHDSAQNIWCNVTVTDKLIKARVNGFPWWPAHLCVPLDSDVVSALEGSGYSIVSSVGNSSLYMVSEKDIIDFTVDPEEDLSQYDIPDLREDLQDAMTIAKKLWRSRNRGVASPWKKKSRPQFSEEKKEEAA